MDEVNPDPVERVESRLEKEFPVVCIGASAGGVEALQNFFRSTTGAGIAYVVILHLSPDYESHLTEVIQQITSLPVAKVADGTRIEPDHIYVSVPNYSLKIRDGQLRVGPITTPEERKAPIDVFFRHLAEARGPLAMAVLLSGTGANGSMGLKRIKEMGGMCLVQQPQEAEYGDMPRNAISTGLVDYVLPVGLLPGKIIEYTSQSSLHIPKEPTGPKGEDVGRALREIFTQLRVRTGHDFSNYKRGTVLRRLERRLHIHQLATLHDYAKLLADQPEETKILLRELLISVTNFFRDRPAFETLEKNFIPRLFESKSLEQSVRVWVAGCATGEEAYSIAMLLHEHAMQQLNPVTLQVFATDIDEHAISKARDGFYTETDVADVTPERLRRYFSKEQDGYRVRKELREMVLFAQHNAIKDPPFSRLDMISCRNLMIYLNATAQGRLLDVLHFALRPGGFLFLGTSESIDGAAALFNSSDKEHRIYQSRSVENRIALPLTDPMAYRSSHNWKPAIEPPAVMQRISLLELHQRLLELYAPPSVVINEDHDILHSSESAARYLQFSPGEPSRSLLRVVRPELRLELRTALFRATKERIDVDLPPARVNLADQTEVVRVRVKPSREEAASGFLLVLFEPVTAGTEQAAETAPSTASDRAESVARQIEEELFKTRVQLRATIEQYELQNEELKASNEELQAMNEELRSASEELETSKEELQSVNEELTTVNQELKVKIEELSQSTNHSRNLMNSTDIATVFLDRGLRVKLFTPRARDLFNLIPADAGRPLLDITHRLVYENLISDIEKVLDNLHTVEREVASRDNRWYIARLRPYRTAEDRIDGVVVTFTEITERKRAEERLRASEEQFRRAVDDAPIPIIMYAEDGHVLQISKAWTELTGYCLDDVPTVEAWLSRAYGDGANALRGHMLELFDGRRRSIEVELIVKSRDGKERHWSFSASAPGALHDGRKYIVGMAVDLMERRRAEEENREATRVQLLQRLASAQEAERRRIARELHDEMGQSMTALILGLQDVESASAGGPLAPRLQKLRNLADELSQQIHELALELRPTALDDLGLGEALQHYLDAWSERSGIRVQYHDGTAKRRLPPEVETALYRVVQESLNNVWKHSTARQVSVVLEFRGNEIAAIIEDDGVGFDVDGVISQLPVSGRLGLLGMRERLAAVGGNLEVESTSGQGSTIHARVPLAPRPAAETP